ALSSSDQRSAGGAIPVQLNLAGAAIGLILRRWSTGRARDLAIRAEAEPGAEAQGAGDRIFELDALPRGTGFLQAKAGGAEWAEPRSRIGSELAGGAIEMRAVALAFEAGILGIEIDQRSKVALPAGVQPIDDNTHLIKITHAKILTAAQNSGRG